MKTTLKYLLLRIKHSPIVLYFFLKNLDFSYLKQWGTIILLAIILYITNIIPFIFYKTILSLEEKQLSNIEKNLIEYNSKKTESIKNIKCIKNQLNRILENEKVKLNYCNK